MRYFNIHESLDAFKRYRNLRNWDRPNLSKVWIDKNLNKFDMYYLQNLYDYEYEYGGGGEYDDYYGYYGRGKKNTTLYPYDFYFDSEPQGFTFGSNNSYGANVQFYIYSSSPSVTFSEYTLPGIIVSYDGYVYNDCNQTTGLMGKLFNFTINGNGLGESSVFIKGKALSSWLTNNFPVGAYIKFSFKFSMINPEESPSNKIGWASNEYIIPALLYGSIYSSYPLYLTVTSMGWRSYSTYIDYFDITITHT